jgi:hypothetical protein
MTRKPGPSEDRLQTSLTTRSGFGLGECTCPHRSSSSVS